MNWPAPPQTQRLLDVEQCARDLCDQLLILSAQPQNTDLDRLLEVVRRATALGLNPRQPGPDTAALPVRPVPETGPDSWLARFICICGLGFQRANVAAVHLLEKPDHNFKERDAEVRQELARSGERPRSSRGTP